MKANFFFIMIICVFFAACGGNQKPLDLTTGKPENAASYQIGTVSEKALSSSANLPGQLVPFNQVNIFPKVNGFVKQILVDRGTIVKKGQLLVILEAPEMESAFHAANSKYLEAMENAEASRQKYQRLYEASKEPGSVSPLELEDANAKMKADIALAQSEKSNLDAAETMLGYLRILAPFDGMIIDRNISPGALVSPGKATDQPMLVLQDIRKMRLTVSIPEDYIEKVDLSHQVSFLFNAIPGQQFTGKISRSANSLGSMQQEAIEIDVTNIDGKLKPGMYAEVAIPIKTGAKSLLVPNNSIIRSTEREYVIKVVNRKAQLADIKVGLAGQNFTEVFGNLKAGDKILLHGNDEIKEGSVLN